jgi:hypothetical protein
MMVQRLDVKLGDHISNTNFSGEIYEVVRWPEDPEDDNMDLKELGSNGVLNRSVLRYYKHYITDDSWTKLSNRDGREVRGVGRILTLLDKGPISEIHELLVRLEI